MNYTAALPREVMGKIIATAASPDASSWTDVIRVRYAMALVNKDWRNALLAQRSMWAFLSVKRCTPASFVKSSIEAAGRGDLTLEVNAKTGPFAPALLARMPVRRVRIVSMADFVAISLTALHPAKPNLIGLIIHADSRADAVDIAAMVAHMRTDGLRRVKIELRISTMPEVAPRFEGALPLADHIDRLELHCAIAMPFQTAEYRHLTALKLSGMEVEWAILGAVFSDCSANLERLDVTAVTPVNWQGSPRLTLPSLGTLVLRYSADKSAQLLSALRLPALHTLHIDVMHFASFLAAYNAGRDVFARAACITVGVSDGEASAFGAILPELGAATELDLRFCHPRVADAVFSAARAQVRLPNISKLQIPTEPPAEEMEVLFGGSFASDLVVVTVYQDDNVCEFTSWRMSEGTLRTEFLGREGSGPGYCGWELDW